MARPMHDLETALWRADAVPGLRSTMGAIVALERAPDPDHLRAVVARAVATTSRLHERVHEPGLPGLAPEWLVDGTFDLDHHLRFLRVPARCTRRDLDALAARIVDDPLDPTRPLWQITSLAGLPGGAGALVVRVHHVLADGLGALELAAGVVEAAPSTPPEPVDLRAELNGAADRTGGATALGERLQGRADDLGAAAADAVAAVLAAAGGLGGASSGEAERLGAGLGAAVDDLVGRLPPLPPGRGTTWGGGGRNRRYASLDVPVDGLRRTARNHGLSVNELFVAAASDAALAVAGGSDGSTPTPPHLNVSVVVSHRTAATPSGTNAVLPVVATLPGAGADHRDRVTALRHHLDDHRQVSAGAAAHLGDHRGLGLLAALLPGPVLAAVVRQWTDRIDLATSNLVGPPIPVFVAGQRVRSIRPVGPVLGTPANLTLVSTDRRSAIGIHTDGDRGPDPADLLGCLGEALRHFGLVDLRR